MIATLSTDDLKKHAVTSLRLAEVRAIIEKAPRLAARHQAYLVREIAQAWSEHPLCADALYEAADAIEEAAREEDAALHGTDVGHALPGASPWERAQ